MRAVTSFFESGGKMAEDIAEEELSRVRAQWAYWREFCKRNVAVTSVLDFPFADAVVPWGLNLSGDKRLLERIYCFEDREDDTHRLRRVILKVHTLRKWGARGEELYLRATKVTAVKVMLVCCCCCKCCFGRLFERECVVYCTRFSNLYTSWCHWCCGSLAERGAEGGLQGGCCFAHA